MLAPGNPATPRSDHHTVVGKRLALLLCGAATVVLICSAFFVQAFALLPEGTDLEIFARYAAMILDGEVPYRDFLFEYPPGALVAIVASGLGEPSLHTFVGRFAAAMVVALALTLVACAGVLTACRASRERWLRALGVVALAPLLLGPVALKRYDALPALLSVLALYLAVRRRFVPSSLVLGLAAAVKLYPLVLLPLVVVAAAGRSRRDAVSSGVAFVAAFALAVIPFLLLSPGGLEASLRWQLDRQLQFESSLASVALVGHVVAGVSVGLVSEAHSYALGGSSGTVLGLLANLALVGGLALVWWRAPRLVRAGDGLVLGFAATIAVLVAFARVLSPQYLLWLVPLVPLVGGVVGRLATGLLVAACILTNVWFPDRYGEVVSGLDGGSIMLLFARNALLVGIAAVLVIAVWRAPERRRE